MSRILIADEQPLFAEAFAAIVTDVLVRAGRTACCAEFSSMADLMRAADRDPPPDAILIDHAVLGTQGLAQLLALRSRLPTVILAVLSAQFDHQRVRLCLTCGVSGFISKRAGREEITRALESVLQGGRHVPTFAAAPPAQLLFHPFGRRMMAEDQEGGPLSGRQAAVLDLVAAGKSNKQIAWELSISETTVKAHMTAILRKLGVNSRAQAIVLLQHQAVQAA